MLRLRSSSRVVSGIAVLLAFQASCSSGSGGNEDFQAEIVLAAGLEQVEPANASPRYEVDLGRLGSGRGVVHQEFVLTTPAGEAFSFDLTARSETNAGDVVVGLAHVRDGTTMATGGAESMARAGCLPTGPGIVNDGPWLTAWGDGFTRITVTGRIDREQVFLVRRQIGVGRFEYAEVAVTLGPRSAINHAGGTVTSYPGGVTDEWLYSSPAWVFGQPAIAVSGDRTSIVTYEGDRGGLSSSFDRYEMRIQHDAATGVVTGGGSEEVSADTGNWRDHEIAALYNVLAVVRGGTDQVSLKLSFDRGATFGQLESVAVPRGGIARLLAIDMALDYSLAVTYWANDGDRAQLVLWEGVPDAFDGAGSPTSFAMRPPVVLYEAPPFAVPLLTGLAWSEGGDLVVGYGATSWVGVGQGVSRSRAEFRCAVRPWNGAFSHVEVDAEEMLSRDPSVALIGQGPGMRIYYAYESTQGVKLAVSANGGGSFGAPLVFGKPGASMPRVFARQDGLATRVDVIYLALRDGLQELHAARWPVFGGSAREDYRLTAGRLEPSSQATQPVGPFGLFSFGLRMTQVAWFGFDAVQDGDEIVVVYDEETMDGGFCVLGGWSSSSTSTTGGGPQLSSPGFSAAMPPPLSAGMVDPVPAPDPSHRHQLRMLRLR